MQINNPFTNGQIKNYLLFYASIVLIMILFFIASTLFNEVEPVETKVFNTDIPIQNIQEKPTEEQKPSSKFKLMDKVY